MHRKFTFYQTKTMFIVLLLILSASSWCQDCRVPGQWCNDHYMCCGGCCINSICIHTYRNCNEKVDLCLQRSCPENYSCKLFTPCLGCEEQAYCDNDYPYEESI